MAQFPQHMIHSTGAAMDLVGDIVGIGSIGPGFGPELPQFLDGLNLVRLQDRPGEPAMINDQHRGRVNDGPGRIFARTADGTAFPDPSSLPQVLRGQVRWIAPVYRMPDELHSELVAPLPHELIARVLDKSRADAALEELRQAGFVQDTTLSENIDQYRFLVVPAPLDHPSYEVREQLQARFAGVLEFYVDYMPVYVPTAMIPTDPLFPSQWNMGRVNAGGAGHTAWDIEQGAATVVICILDDGCQLDHPDLVGQYFSAGVNLGTAGGTGAPNGDHGTPCAGIAAAASNNGVGVAGMAPGCRILPVAFDFWDTKELIKGITYVQTTGARVISMSFGSAVFHPTLVDPIIEAAFAAGVVMCAATQNDDTANGITYPATHPRVLACGASDMTDNRKRATPPTDLLGSNYGPQMSVVAPGVLCPTTDRTGAAGYTNDDYVPDFANTSAATPHVAGLAALLLSADGSLSSAEVRNIIEHTAAKVGGVPYGPGKPNGTWNEEMGYGRIDALAALKELTARHNLNAGPLAGRLSIVWRLLERTRRSYGGRLRRTGPRHR